MAFDREFFDYEHSLPQPQSDSLDLIVLCRLGHDFRFDGNCAAPSLRTA